MNSTSTVLAALIQGRGFSQAQVAEELGVTPGTVSRWVTGKQAVDAPRRRELEALLEVPALTLDQQPSDLGSFISSVLNHTAYTSLECPENPNAIVAHLTPFAVEILEDVLGRVDDELHYHGCPLPSARAMRREMRELREWLAGGTRPPWCEKSKAPK